MSAYSCYYCDRVGRGMYRPHEGETRWYIGLDASGQGHFSCADCKDGLFDAKFLIEETGSSKEGKR